MLIFESRVGSVVIPDGSVIIAYIFCGCFIYFMMIFQDKI